MTLFSHPTWDNMITDLLRQVNLAWGQASADVNHIWGGVDERAASVVVNGVEYRYIDRNCTWVTYDVDGVATYYGDRYVSALIRAAIADFAARYLKYVVREKAERLTDEERVTAEPWGENIRPYWENRFDTAVVQRDGRIGVLGRVPEFLVQDYADDRPLSETYSVFPYGDDRVEYLFAEHEDYYGVFFAEGWED